MLRNFKPLKNILILGLFLILSGYSYSFDAPQLSKPDNNSVCQLPTISFEWLTVNNAIDYQIQISESQAFTTLVDSKTTTTLSATSTKLNYNKTYYWKVGANFNDGGNNITEWSSVFKVSTKNLPIQISPINGATCQNMTLTLNWALPVAGDTFRLQLATSPSFISTLMDEEVLTNSKTITLPNNNSTYYWRVKSSKVLACPNDWTPTYSFTTAKRSPNLLYPPDAATANSVIPSFNWENISTALEYTLQIAKDAAFTTLVADTVVTNPNYLFNNLLNFDTKYYWRVKAKYSDCYSEYSKVYSFRTMYATPKPFSPKDSATCVSIQAVLKWNKISGATKYRVQLNSINDFKTPIFELANITDSLVTVSLPKGLTTYYWRVAAEDQNNKGNYSPVYKFISTYMYPENIYPVNNSGAIPRTMKFKWQSSGNNVKYAIQVSKKSDFSTNLVDDFNISTNEYEVTLPDLYTVYYWRVMVSDTICASTWSSTWQFTSMLNTPVLGSPANNAVKQQLYLPFSWSSVKGATTYNFQLAKDSMFTNIVYGNYGLYAPSISMEQLSPNTKFWWRVRASDKNGYSEWSNKYSFTTTIQGPAIVTLNTPIDGTVKTPLALDLKWNAAARATKYRFQFSETEDFSTKIIDSTNILGTTFSVTGLKNFTTYYWRVYAINDSGMSKSSNVWHFRTIALAPTTIPTLLTPANSSKDLNISINFVWSAVERATDYEIQIAKDDKFTAPFSRIISNNSTRNDNLEFEKNYFWRVKAINEAGETSWSTVWTFNTIKFVSVNDEYFEGKLSIYPNPVNENSIIEIKAINSENAQISLVDLNGNTVKEIYNGNLNEGYNRIALNAFNYSSGNYFVKIKVGENITYRQIVINK